MNYNRNPELIEYFRFKGHYFSLAEYNFFANILFRESNSSIIDRYILFIRIAQHLIVEKKEEYSFLYPLLEKLNFDINDYALKQMVWLKRDFMFPLENHNIEIIGIIDKYTNGEYINAKELVKAFVFEKKSNYIELFKIYAKSLVEANLKYEPITESNSIANLITKLYFDVLSKNENTDNAFFSLIKLAYTFNNSHLGLHFYLFVKEELGWVNQINYSFLAGLNSKFVNQQWTVLKSSLQNIQNKEVLEFNSLLKAAGLPALYWPQLLKGRP